MTSRPTPETDGIEFKATAGMMPPYSTVPSEFARRLERERDESEVRLKAISKIAEDAYELSSKYVHGDIELEAYELNTLNRLVSDIRNITNYPESEYTQELVCKTNKDATK